MTYIIRREGPGLTPERLDELEAARPKGLRQEEPGVYSWCEEAAPSLTAEQHDVTAREYLAHVEQWEALADKARRANDDTSAAIADTMAGKMREQAAHHSVEAARLRKEGGK